MLGLIEGTFQNKRQQGSTLAELMVTISVMSIVVTGMYMLFSEGLHFFRANEASSDAEISILKTLASLSSEASSSNSELMRYYPDPTSAAIITHSGIVFASAIAPDGQVQVEPTSGKLYWQKYVCYYHEPNPANKAKGRLFRKEKAIPTDADHAPNCTGSIDTEAISNALDSYTTDYFAEADDLETRQLGDSICGFTISKYNGSLTMVAPTPIGSYGYALDIVLEAGDPDDTGPESFYIKLESRITPKSSIVPVAQPGIVS